MIFVTVGTQLKFDRLIDWVSETLTEINSKISIVAQVGNSEKYWSNVNIITDMNTKEFEEYIDKAELVISHAGMGTIVTCMLRGKKLIVIPRLMELKEHRNNHQLDTANIYESLGVTVARSKNELREKLEGMLSNRYSTNYVKSNDLVKYLQNYINEI